MSRKGVRISSDRLTPFPSNRNGVSSAETCSARARNLLHTPFHAKLSAQARQDALSCRASTTLPTALVANRPKQID
jgi:hypothetical protein